MKGALQMISFADIIKKSAAAVAFLICTIGAAQAAPAITPAVDREASEATFLSAYDHLINNKIWLSIDELNRSLEQNIYFVDAYYMRSLAYRRIGRYNDAISEMSYYLEVRADDPRAGTILQTMKDEWLDIQRSVTIGARRSEYRFSSSTMRDLFKLPMTEPLSINGLAGAGKLSVIGERIILCDMYGNSVINFTKDGRQPPIVVSMDHPAAAIPLTDTEMLVFGRSGDISNVTFDPISMDFLVEPRAQVNAVISDAEFVDSSLLAIADQRGQSLMFYSMPNFEKTIEWIPADITEKLFEPVALASFGPYLAVADRGNQRVYVIDAVTLSERRRFSVEEPRDLMWGVDGDLWVLSENGDIYSKNVITNTEDDLKRVAQGMTDAWCMAQLESEPIVSSITGRTWWNGSVIPGHEVHSGAMSIYSPWLEDRLESENLFLRAVASSFYQSFTRGVEPSTLAIWRNEVRSSFILDVSPTNKASSRFYLLSRLPRVPMSRSKIVSTMTDVMNDLAELSRTDEEFPKVIVLDSRISATDAEIAELMAFLMHQGIRLDIIAVKRPASASMTKVSRTTLGTTYFSEDISSVPPNSSDEWVICIPLPPETFTFGYPSESTLSLFADIDVIKFTDWLPIWPSLLKKQ